MSLDSGRKPGYPEETHADRGGQRKELPEPGFKHQIWGNTTICPVKLDLSYSSVPLASNVAQELSKTHKGATLLHWEAWYFFTMRMGTAFFWVSLKYTILLIYILTISIIVYCSADENNTTQMHNFLFEYQLAFFIVFVKLHNFFNIIFYWVLCFINKEKQVNLMELVK